MQRITEREPVSSVQRSAHTAATMEFSMMAADIIYLPIYSMLISAGLAGEP